MSHFRAPLFVRVGAGLLVAGVLTLAGAAVAQAHVQVIPDQSAAGTEITKLTFRVPTESERASTVSVKITLPTATPLAQVLAEPLAGWTVSIAEGNLPKPVVLDGTTLTRAPATVTWTAAKGHGVPPGGFQEFALSAGPLPDDAKELSFPTTQTYSDGTVVRWNELQAAGADEPEHPLPSFTVTPALGDADATAATPAPTSTATASIGAASDQPSADTVTLKSTDWFARWLGIGGLLVGAAGLFLAAVAWQKTGRRG